MTIFDPPFSEPVFDPSPTLVRQSYNPNDTCQATKPNCMRIRLLLTSSVLPFLKNKSEKDRKDVETPLEPPIKPRFQILFLHTLGVPSSPLPVSCCVTDTSTEYALPFQIYTCNQRPPKCSYIIEVVLTQGPILQCHGSYYLYGFA